ncbi:hypothetical protein JCM33774_35060 [Actinophytocola sp. KF-1]
MTGERPGATPVQPAGFGWPDPAAVPLDVIAVPDPGTVHDRVRLDLAHRPGLVERLREPGATPTGARDLADSEGNRFCVLTPA